MSLSAKDQYTIRAATAADIPSILGLISSLAEYEHMESLVSANEALIEEWVFQKKVAEIFIGEYQSKAVAYAVIFNNFSTFLGRGGIFLEDLFVLREYRGRGFGKTLLQYIIDLGKERGAGRLEWCCLDWNKPSIEFYKSMGAKQLNEWRLFRLEL